jgi:cytochrome b6-f complex iron-sulfur subunit
MVDLMRPQKRYFSREAFLRLSTRFVLGLAGILGLAGLTRYFSHKPGTSQQTEFDLGPVDEFPGSGKLIRLDIPAVIYRSRGDFMAYSLVCTHLGCILEEDNGSFSCPCHGSSFSAEGVVTGGPAVENLAELKVEQTPDGNLLLHIEGTG